MPPRFKKLRRPLCAKKSQYVYEGKNKQWYAYIFRYNIRAVVPIISLK